jgi:ABC-type nitrate/sulfonate/bicarbonate transport system substrate-binding protein
LKLFFTLCIFIVTILNAHNLSDEQLQKISLQLHWKYQFEFAGFIAAKEKGFYQNAGLDVDLKELWCL